MSEKSLPKPHIEMRNGRSVLCVDGREIHPMGYTSNERLTPGYARRMSEAGINTYFLWVDSGWQNPQSWRELASEAKLVLEVNPDAYIFLRGTCYPPEVWLDNNPEELVTFQDGRTDHFGSVNGPYENKTRMVCLASSKYREEMGDELIKLMEFVEASEFGHRVIGYFLNGGDCGEWNYSIDVVSNEYCIDFSPAFKKFYSVWLRNKYGTEKKLQEAWNDNLASFENPKIPGRHEQLLTKYCYPPKGTVRACCQADWGHFVSPDQNMFLADYYEARNAGTADTIEHLARTIKQKPGSSVLVGAFFGYMGTVCFQTNSNVAPLMLAKSPWVDFLAAPSNYEDRVPGGAATFRSPVDTLALRGKLWVNESDSRTYKTSYGEQVSFGSYTLEDSLSTLKRDFAQVICEDVQAFWFDIQPTWLNAKQRYSNFDDADIAGLFAKQQKLAKEYYDTGRGKVSEIAVVYDQDSLWYLDNESLKDLVWLNRDMTMPRIGAPCDHIFHDDLELENLPDYKMYIFINCFVLSDSERHNIDRIVKRAGKTAVWVYAPGLINCDISKKMSLDNMRDLTGFCFDAADGPYEPTFKITDKNHKFTADLSEHRLYGRFERPIMNWFSWKRGDIQIQDPTLCSPLFFVNDTNATVLGEFVANKKAAYAVKEFDSWNSVYIGAKIMNPSILRGIAKKAGVHVYLDTDDVVYANKLFLAIHSSVEENKRISLPRKCNKVVDAYTEETVSVDCDSFELQMRFGETRMFRVL